MEKANGWVVAVIDEAGIKKDAATLATTTIEKPPHSRCQVVYLSMLAEGWVASKSFRFG
jgi:hypothetical protein